MRTIKFRVFDKEHKEMLVDESMDKIIYGLDEGRPTFGLEDTDGDYRDCVPMQFTGLHDKNGKEIYERDVTRSTEWDDKPREVVYWEGCFCHKREDGNGHIFNPKKVEVIGNIYENLELLS